MVINDNIQVCLALPVRVGLHIGQGDVALVEARRQLGPHRLLGISAKTRAHVEAARQLYTFPDQTTVPLADYVGTGAVYGTFSKAKLADSDIIGVYGAAAALSGCVAPLKDAKTGKDCPEIKNVIIGGINRKTAKRALVGATGRDHRVDGIAVISDIYASDDPVQAAKELRELMNTYHRTIDRPSAGTSKMHWVGASTKPSTDTRHLLSLVSQLQTAHMDSDATPPLVQTITSHVSSTLSANVALALRASPIMSHQAEEADDLSRVTGGIVLNIGTIGPESREGMRAVGQASNNTGKPIVLDPVGMGASGFRKQVVHDLLAQTAITLIKGNAAELGCLADNIEVEARGVDAGRGVIANPVELVKGVAKKFGTLVLLSGKVDYLTDGERTLAVENGSPLLGRITGSGCALGVALAVGMARACAVSQADAATGGKKQEKRTNIGALVVDADPELLFAGAVMALLSVTIASEQAAKSDGCKGPGTFVPAWLDALSTIDAEILVKQAKVAFV